MFSSAVANKQPRSFWMSSSQRLQQRLPVWSSFPPQRSLLQGSHYITDAAYWESNFYSTNMQTGDNWETRRAQGIYQETKEFAGCVSASSVSPKITELPVLDCHPQLVFRKYICGLTVFSSFSGSWRGMPKNSYFLCWGSRYMSTSKGTAFLCKHFSVQHLQWKQFLLASLQFLLFLPVVKERIIPLLGSFWNSYRGQKLGKELKWI